MNFQAVLLDYSLIAMQNDFSIIALGTCGHTSQQQVKLPETTCMEHLTGLLYLTE